MSTVVTTIHRNKHKIENSPLVFTLGDEQIYVYINWEKTTNRDVYLIVEANPNVDVLIPSTFSKMKERIIQLENILKTLL